MSQQSDCCSSSRTLIVMSCSGGSNVGQITNEVAKRLSLAGKAKFFCLAGIGGKISGMIASVKGADSKIVLDGCPVACAKKCMENAGIENYDYLVVTELGIAKKSLRDLPESDIDACMEECLKIVGKKSCEPASDSKGCCG